MVLSLEMPRLDVRAQGRGSANIRVGRCALREFVQVAGMAGEAFEASKRHGTSDLGVRKAKDGEKRG